MPAPHTTAGPIVGPFVVRSRKGNFGNQDLESVLRTALAYRHEPDIEFVESGSGRRFTCAELIDALDRQGHQPDAISPPPSGPPPASPGLASFRNFATSTVDLEIIPPVSAGPAAEPPVTAAPAGRRSDRLPRRSDRSRIVRSGRGLMAGAVAVSVLALALTVYLLVRGR